MDLLCVVVIYFTCKYLSVLLPEYNRLWHLLALLFTILWLLGYVGLGFRRVN